MKLALESCILREKFGDAEGLRLIKEAGFDCVDMSYYWLPEGAELLGEGYREYAMCLRAQLDMLGLGCNQAHAPFEILYGEELSLSNPHYLRVVRAIESASLLGAKTIIVHSIGHQENEQILFDREYNLSFFKSLQPFCEKFGICVAIENLFALDKRRKYYRGRLGTPRELCDFIHELHSPYFTACVDVGHAALTGNEPEEFLMHMDRTLLKAVHIQDGDYLRDCHTLPFLGAYKWTSIMEALKKAGYNGELTFEIFGYLRNIPNELIPEALRFAEKTGRYLISLFEST